MGAEVGAAGGARAVGAEVGAAGGAAEVAVAAGADVVADVVAPIFFLSPFFAADCAGGAVDEVDEVDAGAADLEALTESVGFLVG